MARDILAELGLNKNKGQDISGRDILAELGRVNQQNAPQQQIQQVSNPQDLIDQQRKEHPFLYWPAMALAKNNPNTSEALKRAGEPLRQTREFAEDNLHLPELGAGMLQSLSSAPISLANAGLSPFTDFQFLHPNYRNMLNKPESLGGDIAEGVGQVLGGYGPAVKGFSTLNKIGRPTGWKGVATDILKGLGAGYLLGESPEGEGNESLQKGGGRFWPTILGGALGPVGMSSKSAIGEEAAKIEKTIGKKFDKIYSGIREKAKSLGVGNIHKPQGDYAYLRNHMDKSFKQSLDNFYNAPTFENAHKFQSDIGKWLEKLKNTKIRSGGTLPSAKNKAEEVAIQLQKKVRGSIFNELSIKDKELGKQYQNATKLFSEEMGPWRLPPIQKYKAGKSKNYKLTEELFQNEDFINNLSHLFPQHGIGETIKSATPSRKTLADILKVGIGTASGGGVAGYGYHKYTGGHE